MFGSSVGVIIINKTGRKLLLMASLTICSLCMACIGGCYYVLSLHDQTQEVPATPWIALACLSLFTFSFMIGLAPVPWVLVGELLPGIS